MTRTTQQNRKDIYTRITDQIVNALEEGIKPWTQPWNAAHAAGPVSRPLRHNGQPYSGINVLTLWASSMERHFAAPIWMTFKQARELGGHVQKGEKGSPVVYANTLTRTEVDENTGKEIDQSIPFMKGYTVFNIEQIEGLCALLRARRVSAQSRSADRGRRRVLHRHRRRYPPWWQQRLLLSARRLRADACLRELPRCRKLLRHTCP